MKKIILLLIVASAACKEAYDPPIISTNHAYLVVEGFINNGSDSTVFTLSRSYKLNDTTQTAPPELNAQVNVQGTDNSVYPLPEIGNGQYGAASLTLDPAQQYRLTIVTTDGKQYQSDYVPLKASPPIDSLNWTNSSNGLQIYANTHDPQNQSHYYRWNFSETWEFHAVDLSLLAYVDDTIEQRNPIDFYYCWKSDLSNSVLVGASTKLGQDEIYEAPITLVPPNSWKVSVEYSILVKQYVLTQDAYNFWLSLQTNTEQIGSLFSPEPSTAKGNVHCITDTTEMVLGYVSAGTFSQTRLFIKPEQIPNWVTTEYSDECMIRSTPDQADSLAFYFYDGYNIPVDWTPPAPPFTRVDYDSYSCVDCRAIGTNAKPSFWP